jgi:hypothetical protein
MWHQLGQVLGQRASEECFLRCSKPPLGYSHCREMNTGRHALRRRLGVLQEEEEPYTQLSLLQVESWEPNILKQQRQARVLCEYSLPQLSTCPIALLPEKHTKNILKILSAPLPKALDRNHSTVSCLSSWVAATKSLQTNVTTNSCCWNRFYK